jgi:hypothetical protein
VGGTAGKTWHSFEVGDKLGLADRTAQLHQDLGKGVELVSHGVRSGFR